MPTSRVYEIDGLRAIAMTMVIAQHCWLMPFGWMGVWIFFVISGYVITLSLLADEKGSALQSYARFVTRRFFRIVPLYVLYVLIIVTILVMTSNYDPLKNLPFLATFTYNWQMIYGLIPASGFAPIEHLWTLSIEEQFYIIFPVLMLTLSRKQFTVAMVMVLVAGPFIRYFTSLSSQHLSDDGGWIAFSIYANSFCHFDAFVAGAVLAVARRKVQSDPALLRALWALALLSAIGYAGLYVWINALTGKTGVDLVRNVVSGDLYGQGREVFVYSVVTLLAVALVASCVARHPLTRFLAWPPLVHVGKISYGGYVYHALILFLLGSVVEIGGKTSPVWQRVLEFGIAWPLTIVVASLSFRYFETRFMAPAAKLGVVRR